MQPSKALSGPPPVTSNWLQRVVSSYAVRTLLQALLTVWAVVTFTFFLIRLMPGNPVDVYVGFLMNQSNLTYNEAMLQAASQFSFDPDASVFQQYLGYLGALVRGDLGQSITSTGTQVIDQIARYLPWTLFCVGLGLLLSFIVGMLLGMLTAYYRNSALDTFISFFAAILGAVPDYIWGLLILVIFGVQLQWFNIGALRGTYDPGLTPGFTLAFIWSVLAHAFLPVLVYIIGTLGSWTLNMRSSTISVLGEDYVNVARARGLSPGRIAGTYVGRNAALPLFTLLAVNIGLVIGGSVIIEELFVYKGIGSFLFFSISQRDYTSMQGVFLVIAISVVVANILADLLYSRLDPRVRVEGEG